MAAAAVPAISLGAQYFLNRGSNQRTNQALTTAQTGLQGSATDLGRHANALAGKGGDFLGDAQKTLTGAGSAYNQVGSYYSPILGGSRAAINQSLASDYGAITDTYRGAERALDGMRGGSRDLAKAELNRDRAGKLALLPSQARANAAEGMLRVGAGQQSVGATQAGTGVALGNAATGAKGTAAGAYGTLYGGAQQASQLSQAYNNQAGGAIGRMIFDSVKSAGKKAPGAASGGSGAPAGTNFGWSGVTKPTFG